MNANSENLREQALKEIEPYTEELIRQGYRSKVLLAKMEVALQLRIRALYQQQQRPTPVAQIIGSILSNPTGSKAEDALYFMLTENGISCRSQYKIGRYQADFFIDPDILIEIDGKYHNSLVVHQKDKIRDKYLQKMGYRILRVPVWILSLSPKSVLDEIKDMQNL